MSTSTTAPTTTRTDAPPTFSTTTEQADPTTVFTTAQRWVWPALRVAVGFVFLWTFLDKTFGLGFATSGEKAWITGASPTSGFLAQGTDSPLTGAYAAMSGVPLVDWLFMLGMLGVGVAVVLGVATRIATIAGVLLMVSLRLALLVPEQNPVVDEHLVYVLALVGLAGLPAARRFSLAGWWAGLPVVRRYAVLR